MCYMLYFKCHRSISFQGKQKKPSACAVLSIFGRSTEMGYVFGNQSWGCYAKAPCPSKWSSGWFSAILFVLGLQVSIKGKRRNTCIPLPACLHVILCVSILKALRQAMLEVHALVGTETMDGFIILHHWWWLGWLSALCITHTILFHGSTQSGPYQASPSHITLTWSDMHSFFPSWQQVVHDSWLIFRSWSLRAWKLENAGKCLRTWLQSSGHMWVWFRGHGQLRNLNVVPD